jgi:hypothetical protein
MYFGMKRSPHRRGNEGRHLCDGRMLFLLLLLGGSPASSRAGIGFFTGGERGLWDQDRYSVVVGKISDIRLAPGVKFGGYFATLRPTASLCGNLDPSLYPSLTVGFESGVQETSIQQTPTDGATVIAVVVQEENRAGIISDYCKFMPGASSLVIIRGLDDPKVAETLKRLQAARKAGVAKAAAATQPSAPASAPLSGTQTPGRER